MALASFAELMANAERGSYAVGYFESWNMESLLAVADAAEATQSPVMLGFSGIYLPHPDRLVDDDLSYYLELGRAVCRRISVPACLVFNESPHYEWVVRAVELGFDMVMFTDENYGLDQQTAEVRKVTQLAHAAGVAVEGELDVLPGVGGQLRSAPVANQLTEPDTAQAFVRETGVDALAVNIGQAHMHGRAEIHLNLSRLTELRSALDVPLVLHGASSVSRTDLVEAIKRGIRKVNVGSVLKRAYFDALHKACADVNIDYNPYEVIGSGLKSDVLTAGRIAMQRVVEDQMRLFGSAGKAAAVPQASTRGVVV